MKSCTLYALIFFLQIQFLNIYDKTCKNVQVCLCIYLMYTCGYERKRQNGNYVCNVIELSRLHAIYTRSDVDTPEKDSQQSRRTLPYQYTGINKISMMNYVFSLSITAMARISSLHPSHRFLLLCARSGTISCRSRMCRQISKQITVCV